MRALVAVVLIAGCAHHAAEALPALPDRPIGGTHVPYTGEPAGLHPKPEPSMLASREDGFVARMRSPAERQRELRGLLADADSLLASGDLGALPPVLREIELLLRPYPDIRAEIEELEKLAAGIDQAVPIERERQKRRMEDLIDLIRLQLFSAR